MIIVEGDLEHFVGIVTLRTILPPSTTNVHPALAARPLDLASGTRQKVRFTLELLSVK